MQEIARNATTGGRYKDVCELYSFKVQVVSEETFKDGLPFIDNRFVVEGNYKYTFNNGRIAMADTHAAATNFLNALDKIPSIIEQYKEKNEKLAEEIPKLREIASKTWKKEDEIKSLKSELSALERKIQMELAPPQPEMEQKAESVAAECEVTKREGSDSLAQRHILVVSPDDGIANKRRWQRSL